MSRSGNSWRRMKFGAIAECINDRVDDPAAAGVERYVGLEHLETDSLRIRHWGTPDEVESTKLRFRPGDIIFGKRRAYQRKLAVADFEGICSAHAMVLRARPEAAEPDFLPFFMQSDVFMDRALAISVGSLSPTINWKTLAEVEFALPPQEEQRRMLLVLTAAERVRRDADHTAGCARIALHSLFEHAHRECVARFPVVPLEEATDVGRPITYGILMPGTGFPGGVPVVKVRDFPDGEIQTQNLLLTDPAIDEEYRRSRLRPGDVLVSIRGTIGRIAVVPAELAGANITQDTARLSFPSNSNPSYFRGLLESATLQHRMHSNVPPPAPAGMPPSRAKPRDRIQGLNITELRRVRVPVPPRRVQDEYAGMFELARHAMIAAGQRAHEVTVLKARLIERLLGGG